MEEEVNKTETRLKNVTSKSNERIAQLETELDSANIALIGKIILSSQLKQKIFYRIAVKIVEFSKHYFN